MLRHLYPNLELAQAKSSLKYRVASFHGSGSCDRPRSPDPAPAHTSPSSRRQYHVPTLSHHSDEDSVHFFNEGARVTGNPSITGKRRRRAELSSSPTLSTQHHHRSSSLTTEMARATTAAVGVRIQRMLGVGAENDTDSEPRLSPTLTRKLETIDHIIARADGREAFRETTSTNSPPRRGSNAMKLDPLTLEAAVSTETDQGVHKGSPMSTVSRRKVSFLMKQNKREASKLGDEKEVSPQRDRARSVTPAHRVSTRYLITAPDEAASATTQPLLTPIVAKQESQRSVNNARVMEFVDTANNKPRSIVTTSPNGGVSISLDKQLRRISLVSFEQADGSHASTRRLLTRTNSSLALRRKQMFGIYSIREVMAVIRLFWFLDADRSGGITLDELYLHREFFTQLGRNDLEAVFHELDVDGNGSIALNELLRVCFRHSNDHQLQAMLTLAKVGGLHEYLTGRHSAHHVQRDKSDELEDERRKELQEIFHVFDRNGDGRINRDELFEALEIDHELFAPALETARGSWAENARRLERAKAGGLTKEDIDTFYRECDKNNDGTLDFDEFAKLMDAAAS